MKSLKVFAVALAAFALLTTSSIQAQSQKGEGWRERMKSEKIGFITMELNLSPEEAQVFWPVYNEVADQKAGLQKTVKEAYTALLNALKTEEISDTEIDKLLDNYLAAKQAVQEFTKGNAAKYRKVLSSKKVAKLYVAEEKFRRQNIRNLGGPKPHGGPQGAHQGRPHGGPHAPQNAN